MISKCQKKQVCDTACKWTNWSEFGPCLGPCGSNGIQWSFRNPESENGEDTEQIAEDSNCVGIFQKSRRCITEACPFCIDETGYDENSNESQENLVNRVHKYGEQWIPVDQDLYPCHICTCLDNGKIACAKYCSLRNIGCPEGQELIVPDESDNTCCYCYDPSATTIKNLISTVTNFFGSTITPLITFPPDVITIKPDQDLLDNCRKNGNLVCDIQASGNFKCLPSSFICDNVQDCQDHSDENNCSDNCFYTRWSEWSACSQTCNVGEKYRNRALHPDIDLDKLDCSSFTTFSEVQPCMDTACKIDGTWSKWNPWSKTCSEEEACKDTPFAVQSTVRYCNNPAPTNNGRHCEGIHYKERVCKSTVELCQGNTTCSGNFQISVADLSARDCTNLFKQAHPRTACGKLAVTCTDILEKKCEDVENPSPTFSIHQFCKLKPKCIWVEDAEKVFYWRVFKLR